MSEVSTFLYFQCQNVGSDGFDAQWKCETDMDDSYRFGKIQVTCEGYDYPNDPYVLRGILTSQTIVLK